MHDNSIFSMWWEILPLQPVAVVFSRLTRFVLVYHLSSVHAIDAANNNNNIQTIVVLQSCIHSFWLWLFGAWFYAAFWVRSYKYIPFSICPILWVARNSIPYNNKRQLHNIYVLLGSLLQIHLGVRPLGLFWIELKEVHKNDIWFSYACVGWLVHAHFIW